MHQNPEQLPSALTDPAFDAARWVRAQQQQLLSRHTRLAAIGGVLATVVLALLLWEVTPPRPLLVWVAAGVAIGLLRLAVGLARSRQGELGSPAWHRFYVGLVLASGLNWGAMSLFLFPDSIGHQVFIAFMVAGMTAASASVHAPAQGGFLLFALPALLPLTGQFASQHSSIGYGMAGMVVLFLLLMTVASRETSRMINNVLGLQVENLELTRALHHQATHDSLVGLINHGEFQRQLEAMATVAAVRHEPYALIFIDLDLFKEVNDKGGHAAGDEMLRQIGMILKSKVRTQDATARLGGDEFGILLQRCPAEQALRIAREVLQAISEFEMHRSGDVFRVGASIGVAYSTAGEHDAESLLKAADAACYAAKEAGRNQVRMFHADPSFSSTGRFHLSTYGEPGHRGLKTLASA